MKRLLLTVFCFSAGALFAQPSINAGGVLNSASYAYAGLPNAAIAQGSLFVVFGKAMGPNALQQITAFPLTNTLGGTSLSVTVGGTTTKPLMVYTSAGQIGAIMPSSTPVGTGSITVTYNGQTSAGVPVQIASSSVGIYAVNQAGSGPGIVTNTAYATADLNTAANPGETYILWGTGVGPVVSGDEAQGGGAVKLGTLPVQVFVGGVAAAVGGYARSGCCVGIDQIAFVVPAGVTGCHVPVVVQVGNVVSNFISMPVAASGRTCTDSTSILPSSLNPSGNVATGGISLSRTNLTVALPAPIGNTVSTTDTGAASFSRYSYAQYLASQNPLQVSTFGACSVFTFTGASATYVDPLAPKVLDAGSTITVQGPNGTKTITKMNGAYIGSFGGGVSIPGLPAAAPTYLSKGSYSVNNGSGGTDIGPFTANITIPDPLVWTNQATTTTITRATPLTLNWTGGDPAGTVEIIGYSTTLTPPTVGAEFVCTEKTSAGKFTVPPAVLLALPANNASNAAGVSGAILGIGYGVFSNFKATGLDQGILSANGLSFQSVNVQ